jgi:hypothetical protein
LESSGRPPAFRRGDGSTKEAPNPKLQSERWKSGRISREGPRTRRELLGKIAGVRLGPGLGTLLRLAEPRSVVECSPNALGFPFYISLRSFAARKRMGTVWKRSLPCDGRKARGGNFESFGGTENLGHRTPNTEDRRPNTSDTCGRDSGAHSGREYLVGSQGIGLGASALGCTLVARWATYQASRYCSIHRHIS